jgi:hypothetical protein
MHLLLYTSKPPSGRCLLLADQLRKATDLGDQESMRMAQRLFDGQHSRDHPALINVPESRSADNLVIICVEYGIEVEITKH